MVETRNGGIAEILQRHESDLLADWMRSQKSAVTLRPDLLSESELEEQSRRFLSVFTRATRTGDPADITASDWEEVREALAGVSRDRARKGFSPSETAVFVFSLKEPLFSRLRRELGRDPEALAAETWRATVLLDKLGLFTTEVHQKGRDEMIARQQQEILELSTPVIKLWEGILGVPLIGVLDSSRTQVVMESLLQEIVRSGSSLAIIDITGVPTVDTLVAQHLLKTVAAIRLMGADCIISGVRPQIAQTIVHLGVDLREVTTKASLADALALALKRLGFAISRS